MKTAEKVLCARVKKPVLHCLRESQPEMLCADSSGSAEIESNKHAA